MKLKEGFITHTAGDDQLLLSVRDDGFKGVIRSNRTAAAIIDLLKTDTTRENIIAAMCARFDVQPEEAARGVDAVLARLRELGAVEG